MGDGIASVDLDALGGELRLLELGAFAAGAWASVVAGELGDEAIVVLPASPDGRDLAPRLAHALGRVLVAGAIRASEHEVVAARAGGLELHTFSMNHAAVVTLQPGAEPLMELTFDDQRQGMTFDARPALPLVLRY